MTDLAPPRLSVIVVAHNMRREVPRTVLSLSPSMQREMEDDAYEIIVVDNGSDQPLDQSAFSPWGKRVRIHRMSDASPSPAAAINKGLELARGTLIGVFVDGARLASPGLLSGALRAARLGDRSVIGTLGFHLGPAVQMKSIKRGYTSDREDALLDSVNWSEDGYRLFDISVFAGSSSDGWFAPIAESNAVFMHRALWRELGGYDARFSLPGGGLVNHDTWRRASELEDVQLVILLGEGTFHQIHGGIASNSKSSMMRVFREDYRILRGKAFDRPQVDPVFMGKIDLRALPSIARSARFRLSGGYTWKRRLLRWTSKWRN